MPAIQVRDILEGVRRIHHQLSERYEALSKIEPDERLDLLLEYMARHEENFNQCLARYEDEAASGILDTWLPFVPDEITSSALEQVEMHAGVSADELIGNALSVDKRLIALYEVLAGSTSVPHVQELFTNLVQLEEAKDRRYSSAICDLQGD